MITTILIDMYGVILEESKGRFIPYTFAQFDQREHQRLERMLRQEQLFTRAGNGELTSDEFLRLLGYEDTRYHMENYLSHYVTLDSGFVPFAEKHCEKYELVLLSNDVSEWSAFMTEYHHLNPYFRQKIVSGDVKCRKPDRQIFEIALERTGRQASEVVFVDNSVQNLRTAEALGMVPVLFNRDGASYEGITVNNFRELEEALENMAAVM